MKFLYSITTTQETHMSRCARLKKGVAKYLPVGKVIVGAIAPLAGLVTIIMAFNEPEHSAQPDIDIGEVHIYSPESDGSVVVVQ